MAYRPKQRKQSCHLRFFSFSTTLYAARSDLPLRTFVSITWKDGKWKKRRYVVRQQTIYCLSRTITFCLFNRQYKLRMIKMGQLTYNQKYFFKHYYRSLLWARIFGMHFCWVINTSLDFVLFLVHINTILIMIFNDFVTVFIYDIIYTFDFLFFLVN